MATDPQPATTVQYKYRLCHETAHGRSHSPSLGSGGDVLERGHLNGVSKDKEGLGRQRARRRWSRQRRQAGTEAAQGPIGNCK